MDMTEVPRAPPQPLLSTRYAVISELTKTTSVHAHTHKRTHKHTHMRARDAVSEQITIASVVLGFQVLNTSIHLSFHAI